MTLATSSGSTLLTDREHMQGYSGHGPQFSGTKTASFDVDDLLAHEAGVHGAKSRILSRRRRSSD